MTQHPQGYPQTVRTVEGKAGRWYVTVDRWDTATSHSGRTREAGPYRTRAAALASIDAVHAEQD